MIWPVISSPLTVSSPRIVPRARAARCRDLDRIILTEEATAWLMTTRLYAHRLDNDR